MTTQIESCACGGMTAVSTKWAKDALLFIQSFRDAHQKCRDVFIEQTTALANDDGVQVEPAPPTERIDLPETAQFIPQRICPSCGHYSKGRLVCGILGIGGVQCGCAEPWHVTP